MATTELKVLATFQRDESFPIEWAEGEADLFWVLDDLHCPNPLSPLFFDLGGWWLTCDHMFRRFGTPFACDWIAKNVNGYLYTAAIPADPSARAEANDYQARYVPRVPHGRDRGRIVVVGLQIAPERLQDRRWILPPGRERELVRPDRLVAELLLVGLEPIAHERFAAFARVEPAQDVGRGLALE